MGDGWLTFRRVSQSRAWAFVAIACAFACSEASRDSETATTRAEGPRRTAAVTRPRADDESERPSAVEAYFDVHGDTLSTPHHGHISLGQGHGAVDARTRIRVSPSQQWVIVATNRGACGPGGTHLVDLVELESRMVRRIAYGDGWVRVSFRGEDPQVERRACD